MFKFAKGGSFLLGAAIVSVVGSNINAGNAFGNVNAKKEENMDQKFSDYLVPKSVEQALLKDILLVCVVAVSFYFLLYRPVLSKMKSEINVNKEELTKKETEILEKCKEIGKLTENIGKQKKELEVLRDQHKTDAEKLDKLNNELYSNKIELVKEKSEKDSLIAKMEEKKKDILNKEQKISKLENAVTKLEDEIKELNINVEKEKTQQSGQLTEQEKVKNKGKVIDTISNAFNIVSNVAEIINKGLTDRLQIKEGWKNGIINATKCGFGIIGKIVLGGK